jgi:hypothetical protein
LSREIFHSRKSGKSIETSVITYSKSQLLSIEQMDLLGFVEGAVYDDRTRWNLVDYGCFFCR